MPPRNVRVVASFLLSLGAILPSVAVADATVDGFYPSELVRDGHFKGERSVQPEAQGVRYDYVPPGVREQPLAPSGNRLSEPKLYEGKFIKSTRGVEAADFPDPRESHSGTVLVAE